MALGVDLSILNQRGTPAFFSDIFANRPAFGFAGRVFISTDTGAIYEDTGTAWTLIADAGAGTTGTLQQVTTNGNTTTQGISITAGGLSANSITNTSLTTGSVAFVGAAGLMTQDNANFFWDDTNNRLGLGTSAPSAKLDIHGAGAMALFNGTSTNNGYIGFQNAGVTQWTIGNQYAGGTNTFAINNSSGTAIFGITGGTQANFQYSLVSYGTFSAFNVGDQIRVAGGAIDARIGTNSGDNLMFIGATSSTTKGINIELSNGNILVNTITDGGQKLQVNGTSLFSNTVSVNNNVFINSSYALYLNNVDNTTTCAITNGAATGISQMQFYIASTERGRFSNSGNFLINTLTDNGAKLQVNGTACINTTTNFNASLNVQYDGNTINAITTRPINSYSAATINFQNISGTTVGYILTSAAAVAYVTTSDYRLKQDLKNYNGLDIINSIKTYDYQWKIDKSRMYGVIAHELKEIIPYAVTGEKDAEIMQGVDYSKIVPILVKAIQELNEKLVRNNIN